mgnify:FL=1
MIPSLFERHLASVEVSSMVDSSTLMSLQRGRKITTEEAEVMVEIAEATVEIAEATVEIAEVTEVTAMVTTEVPLVEVVVVSITTEAQMLPWMTMTKTPRKATWEPSRVPLSGLTELFIVIKFKRVW